MVLRYIDNIRLHPNMAKKISLTEPDYTKIELKDLRFFLHSHQTTHGSISCRLDRLAFSLACLVGNYSFPPNIEKQNLDPIHMLRCKSPISYVHTGLRWSIQAQTQEIKITIKLYFILLIFLATNMPCYYKNI